MKEMRERSGGVYQASAGSVYPTLQQLEDEGLIESERDSGRRVYSLTQAGRDELAKDPEAVRRIWERAERWEDWGQWMGPQTLAFVGPMAVLAKSAMRAATLAAGDPEREQRLRDTIERMRHEFDQMFR
jgi:DNA-binding MarR family transcriptional regulator